MSTEEPEAYEQIRRCLTPGEQRSFVLHAGAGSGKTRCLVATIRHLINSRGRELNRRGAQIAVITYTTAATAEIRHRLGHDPLVHVSTIHAFAWTLVGDATDDIRTELRKRWLAEIDDCTAAEAKARPAKLGTRNKASDDRKRKIARAHRRLAGLDDVISFRYDPTRIDTSPDSVMHAEVLYLLREFLVHYPQFGAVLAGRFPIVLIDEVQDTNKEVMEALLNFVRPNPDDPAVCRSPHKTFSLGFFGDSMQRIYLDGLPNLNDQLPGGWKHPQLGVNFRSGERIVQLVNNIRALGETHPNPQTPECDGGIVRLFLAASGTSDHASIEHAARQRMAVVSETMDWHDSERVTTLILEHAMAGDRLNFRSFIDPFGSDFRDDVLDKDRVRSGPIAFLGATLVPLARAFALGDLWTAERIITEHHHPDRDETYDRPSETQLADLQQGAWSLRDLAVTDETPLRELIANVHRSGLLHVPDILVDAIASGVLDTLEEATTPAEPELPTTSELRNSAWANAIHTPVDMFERYYRYVTDATPLDTLQGVKGREAEHVMVIADDDSARGNTFSFEKLFQVTPASATDTKNSAEGKDTSILRTLRLFYVACSRARTSLAIVNYTEDVEAVHKFVVDQCWFTEDEIEILH